MKEDEVLTLVEILGKTTSRFTYLKIFACPTNYANIYTMCAFAYNYKTLKMQIF